MIKDFSTYINEDYFSKLASRKDNGNVRKENEITEDYVMSFFNIGILSIGESKPNISFRKENGKTFVDIDGCFHLRKDVEEIPFQFGIVTVDFNCSGCKNLTSLKGCPEKVGGVFSCYLCEKLTSLEGCPKEVGKNFNCWDCGEEFSGKDIKSLCNVKGIIYV